MAETGLKPMNVRDAVTSFPTKPKNWLYRAWQYGGGACDAVTRSGFDGL